MSPAEAMRALYAARRARGVCVDCEDPSPRAARCQPCAAVSRAQVKGPKRRGLRPARLPRHPRWRRYRTMNITPETIAQARQQHAAELLQRYVTDDQIRAWLAQQPQSGPPDASNATPPTQPTRPAGTVRAAYAGDKPVHR